MEHWLQKKAWFPSGMVELLLNTDNRQNQLAAGLTGTEQLV